MRNKAMIRVERAFHEIADAMKDGQFERHQLEGIKSFSQAVITATDKALERGPIDDKSEQGPAA